jgi:S1-C subfamily serine protease
MTDDRIRAVPETGEPERRVTASIVHLSGPLRGTTQRLTDPRIRIGTAADAEVHFPTDRAPHVGDHHAILTRAGETYVLESIEGHEVRVNGEHLESVVLHGEDVIEIGASGPILRFRIGLPDGAPHKSMREALADCLDCARSARGGPIGSVLAFVRSMPRELLSQTTPRARAAGVTLLLVTFALLVSLFVYSWRLDRRITRDSELVDDIAALLEGGDGAMPTRDELGRIRADLEGQLSSAVERVEALEARSLAAERVISTAARSVVFLQGSYGFLQAPDSSPVRVLLGPDGRPLTDAEGNPIAGPRANGPRLERLFTGTGFVVSENGLLLTNRHIVQPWDFDPSAQRLVAAGLQPVMYRLIGYVPDTEEAFELEMVVASDRADVAVLRAEGLPPLVTPLHLSEVTPAPGSEVLVLGYPTGIRALLARTDPVFVDELMRTPGVDFWEVARRLAQRGHIAPLATRGIVGQVTETHVVYDAETTRGGSGGPVLDLEIGVVAVNAAVLNEFGGSNLGVPAAEALSLLESARSAAGIDTLETAVPPGESPEPPDGS